MPRFADDHDPLTEDEWPDEADVSDDDGVALIRCGHCGEMIAEDSPQCPYCKTWGPHTRTAGLGRGIKRIVWTLVVLALIWVILVVWHGLGR